MTGDGTLEQPDQVRHILVLGANGPTGRQVVQQGLDRGLAVTALTRHPADFPLTDSRLDVMGGDATEQGTVEPAVAQCDAVISVIGAAYTRSAVEVYSLSGRLVVEAMQRHRRRRLIVVTSSSVAPESARQGRFVFDHVALPLLRHVIGRTVYDDMDRLEAIVTASGLDWTIVRPPGLTSQAGTGYTAAETRVAGMLCARSDLATFLLDQLDDPRYLQRIAAVSSPTARVSPIEMIRREMLKR